MNISRNRPTSSVASNLQLRPMTAFTGGPTRRVDGDQRKQQSISEEEHLRRQQLLRDDLIKKKNQRKDENALIEEQINKIQNEKSINYLVKISEANDMCQKLKNAIDKISEQEKRDLEENGHRLNYDKVYKVFNNADGSVKCQVEFGYNTKTISLDDFDREFKILVEDFNTIYLKQERFQILNDLAKPKKKHHTATTDVKQAFVKPEEKVTRQDQLKECLRETMNLTKTLKSQ